MSTTLRAQIVALAQWAIDNEPQIHYLQKRPMTSLPKWKTKTLPMACDCSEAVTGLYYACGAPDPNGCDYNGTGYTGTLLANNPHIAQSNVVAGDIGIFVNPEGDSVHAVLAMVAGGASVFSHGFEGGPLKVTLAQEKGYHPGCSLVWVRALPTAAAPGTSKPTWRVIDGSGHEIATTTRPGMWALRHAGLFRTKQIVRFIRVGGPK